MPRKTKPPARPAAKADAPSLETLLARQAGNDPRAWEAMLNLNKMRSAQRRRHRDADDGAAPLPPAKRR